MSQTYNDALESVKKRGMTLKMVSPELKKNKGVVTEAVKENGLALQFADEELQYDRDVVLAAVRQNGLALQYAPSHIQKGSKHFSKDGFDTLPGEVNEAVKGGKKRKGTKKRKGKKLSKGDFSFY